MMGLDIVKSLLLQRNVLLQPDDVTAENLHSYWKRLCAREQMAGLLPKTRELCQIVRVVEIFSHLHLGLVVTDERLQLLCKPQIRRIFIGLANLGRWHIPAKGCGIAELLALGCKITIVRVMLRPVG